MQLTNEQYDAVMRRYDEIRDRKRYEQEQRKRHAYTVIPELAALEDEVTDRSMRAVRARLEHPDWDTSRYRADLEKIAGRKKALLSAAGFPPGYLDLEYECPDCRDTGLINGKHCRCFDRIASKTIYGEYSISDILEEENFSRFSYEWYPETLVDEASGETSRSSAVRAVKAVKAMFNGRSIHGNLFIFGKTGVGKTFLTHCLAKEADRRGLSFLYFSSGQFFDTLAKTAFGRKDPARKGVSSMVSSCDLLIIDDLGTEWGNSFTVSELFRILNDRAIRGKSTVISSNLDIGGLAERYTERVSSRIISDYTIVKLIGDDIRVRKRMQKAGREL